MKLVVQMRPSVPPPVALVHLYFSVFFHLTP